MTIFDRFPVSPFADSYDAFGLPVLAEPAPANQLAAPLFAPASPYAPRTTLTRRASSYPLHASDLAAAAGQGVSGVDFSLQSDDAPVDEDVDFGTIGASYDPALSPEENIANATSAVNWGKGLSTLAGLLSTPLGLFAKGVSYYNEPITYNNMLENIYATMNLPGKHDPISRSNPFTNLEQAALTEMTAFQDVSLAQAIANAHKGFIETENVDFGGLDTGGFGQPGQGGFDPGFAGVGSGDDPDTGGGGFDVDATGDEWHAGGLLPGAGDREITAEGGEFVIQKDAVDNYGRGLFAALNSGLIPAKNLRGLFSA